METEIVQKLIPWSAYGLKCPYEMTPDCIVVHNTANDATARNEIAYMGTNGSEVSFHFAVDDKEIVQGIPLNRNAWHAGDGNGRGNRTGIGIEICYSKTGGQRFAAAERNAARLIAWLLGVYGWGMEKVTKHQDYDGKYCPHRTMDMGWTRFLALVKTQVATAEKTEETMTKDEMRAIFQEWMEEKERETQQKPVSTWAQGSWGMACQHGVFDGSMPQAALTREQAAKVFDRMGLLALGSQSPCPDYARASWQKAVELRVFDGSMPQAPLTRAQAALVLDRIGALDTMYEPAGYGEDYADPFELSYSDAWDQEI